MYDPNRVRAGQRAGRLGEEPICDFWLKEYFASQTTGEILTVHVLYDEIGHAVPLPVIQDVDDIFAADSLVYLNFSTVPRCELKQIMTGTLRKPQRASSASLFVARTPNRPDASRVDASLKRVTSRDDHS